MSRVTVTFFMFMNFLLYFVLDSHLISGPKKFIILKFPNILEEIRSEYIFLISIGVRLVEIIIFLLSRSLVLIMLKISELVKELFISVPRSSMIRRSLENNIS